MGELIDIGHGVCIEYTAWADHPKVGLIRYHPKPDGTPCVGSGLLFDLPGVHENFPSRALWQVEEWEPLTISPSLLCSLCGHHGWVRSGLWVPA